MTGVGGHRGFTVLETLLAASIGSMVVLVALSIFGAVDRTDRGTSLRFNQTEAMSRTHLVMERVFSNLVMADLGAGRKNQARNTAQPEGQAEKPPREDQSGRPEENDDIEWKRPRIILEMDRSPSLSRAASGAGLNTSGVQRLEVVVSTPPVPTSLHTGGLGMAMAEAALEPDARAGPTIRGVFELRPDRREQPSALYGVSPSSMAPGLDPRRVGWTLWWRALPHDLERYEEALSIDPWEDPDAVPVASGLAGCSWRAFSKRDRAELFTATEFQDLPAYMELECRTTGGLTANWMFEVGWSNGPETQQELEELEEANQAAAAGGGPGAGPGAGAAGGAGGAGQGAGGKGGGAGATGGTRGGRTGGAAGGTGRPGGPGGGKGNGGKDSTRTPGKLDGVKPISPARSALDAEPAGRSRRESA